LSAELQASRRKIKNTYRIAVVGVNRIKTLGERYSRQLYVKFCPDDEQLLPSHAEIRGIALMDHVLQQKIADEAETYPIEQA